MSLMLFVRSVSVVFWVVVFILYNVCAVPWGVLSTMGVFSTMGDIMINVGDILSTMGVFSTVGDIMSTVGVFSTMGDIMINVGIY